MAQLADESNLITKPIRPQQIWPSKFSNSKRFLPSSSSKSQETSKTAEKLLDEVATALLSKMIENQDPRTIKTRSIMEMRLSRQSPRSLGANSDLSAENLGFKVHYDAITDMRASEAKYIDIVVSSLPHASNAFGFSKTDGFLPGARQKEPPSPLIP